jgi:hypothetical protein
LECDVLAGASKKRQLGCRTPKSAFFGGDGEEGGDFLVDVLGATLGAFDVAFFVFRKSEDHFERLFAIFAVELVARHGNLRTVRWAGGF